MKSQPGTTTIGAFEMENNPSNRMASTRKRGNPGSEEILARGQPEPLVEIGTAAPKLPTVKPMICPCCGRGMTPKIVRTEPTKRYINCTLCGGKMTLTYRTNLPTLVARI
jgi:hypothetical protein